MSSSSRASIDVSPEAHQAKRALLDRLSTGAPNLEQLADLVRDLHNELHPAERKSSKDAPMLIREKPTT
jgi:hypothetical protein